MQNGLSYVFCLLIIAGFCGSSIGTIFQFKLFILYCGLAAILFLIRIMRTRRQAKIQQHQSISPPKKKNQMVRGRQKKDDNSLDAKKPSKRVKKDKPASPSPSPEPKRTARGRGKKSQRVSNKSDDKSKEKEKENKKHEKDQRKNQKSENAQKQKKQEAKRKEQEEKDKKKEERKSKSKNKENKEKAKENKRSRSPSPKKESQKKSPEKQEIKKVVVKGAAPVDQYFDRGKDFHVLVHNNKVYSATLNQTNISNNNNKYYNLQILQSDKDPNVNFFMTRWGRVGTPGQKSIQGPFSINIAISEYNSKFNEKHKKGEYRQLELNFGEEEQNEQKKDESNNNQQSQQQNPMTDYQQSTLPKPTKDLINLIFDLGMMNRQMKQIGYNVNKMPLGKLSKDNIKKGYNILKKLYDQIEQKKREDVMEELTNDFYSYIPHDVGFRNMRLYKLDTLKKVKEKLEMLESLAEIKIATQILGQKQQGNKIDNNYKKLNRNIQPIEKDSFTFKLINDYLQSTHATTHRAYDLELVDLFEVQSEMQKGRYMSEIPNKMLLWHGSRLTNFVGILSQGLRIAPPEAPVTGYMFGKGVYFADMSSKSANYCFTTPENNTGILILCEVALGNCNEKMHADPLASNLPDGKHSTKGVGKTAPKPQNFQTLDGVTIPMGPGLATDVTGCSLLYNEFIVYKVEQIKIKYLLRTKFNYKRLAGY